MWFWAKSIALLTFFFLMICVFCAADREKQSKAHCEYQVYTKVLNIFRDARLFACSIKMNKVPNGFSEQGSCIMFIFAPFGQWQRCCSANRWDDVTNPSYDVIKLHQAGLPWSSSMAENLKCFSCSCCNGAGTCIKGAMHDFHHCQI